MSARGTGNVIAQLKTRWDRVAGLGKAKDKRDKPPKSDDHPSQFHTLTRATRGAPERKLASKRRPYLDRVRSQGVKRGN